MSKKALIITLTVLYFQGVNAQSLLHSKPLEYNSGFAGSKTDGRLSLHFNEIGEDSKNLYFSYDKLNKSLKGGIGFYGNTKSQSLKISDKRYKIKERRELSKIGIIYSPKFLIHNKVLLSPSILIDYNRYSYVVKETLDAYNHFLSTEDKFGFLGTNLGILANTKKGYFGYQYFNQFIIKSGNQSLHSFQSGYVFTLEKNINIIVDARYNYGNQLDFYWRNYSKQLNLAYQFRSLFVGAGLNDFNYVSALAGIKLINLKVNMAYHILNPYHTTNFELGVQYIFNKDNDEKIRLPFERWLIKLKR